MLENTNKKENKLINESTQRQTIERSYSKIKSRLQNKQTRYLERGQTGKKHRRWWRMDA